MARTLSQSSSNNEGVARGGGGPKKSPGPMAGSKRGRGRTVPKKVEARRNKTAQGRDYL
jgi:hypothetical protein